jgi:uncharacterized membrane protein
VNTLSTWTFDTPDGAEAALRTLDRLQTQQLITVDDASVVVWPIGTRRPCTYQAGPATGTAALSGAFWGMVFGQLFLLPLVGVPLTGACGLDRVGLSDDVLRDIRERVVPGTSALFLLTGDAVVDRIRAAITNSHTDLLVSTLGHEQATALREAFGVDEAPLR